MNATRKRNKQIIEMRERGVSRRDVALKFRLTAGRIAMIERAAAVQKLLAERRVRLRAEIRDSDDLDKQRAVVDLIDALRLIVIARMRLLAHFEGIHKTQISLREFMNLAVAETKDAETEHVTTPLLQVRGIGKYGYYSVIGELTGMDLGQRCNEEWRNRLAKLRRLWPIPSWPPNSGEPE